MRAAGGRRWRQGGLGWWATILAVLACGCSLGNVSHDECSSAAECTGVFGLGSTCDGGYCTEPAVCDDGAACRAAFGLGTTCVDARCVVSSVEPRCTISEPEGMLESLPTGGDRIVLGGMFKLRTEKELARATATRLAVREINNAADGIDGRELGVVLCDNDSDDDATNDTEETEALALYLGGTLGVPVIIGPSSSANAIVATTTLVEERLATAVISPSATSSSLTDLLDRFDPDADPFGLFWRTCPSDSLQGEVLSTIVGDTGETEVAVILQNDTYGQGLLKVFRAAFEALPSNTVEPFTFEIGEADLADAVADAAAANPGAVVVISSDAARTVKVLEAAAATTLLDKPFFLTDGSKDSAVLFSSTDPDVIGTILPNVRGTAPASPQGLVYDTFADNLQGQFDVDASQFSFVAHTYDATYVAAYGIVYALGVLDEAGEPPGGLDGFAAAAGFSRLTSGDAVDVGPTDFTSAVSNLRTGQKECDISGTSGALAFDASTGEAPGRIEVWRVVGMGFETVAVVDP